MYLQTTSKVSKKINRFPVSFNRAASEIKIDRMTALEVWIRRTKNSEGDHVNKISNSTMRRKEIKKREEREELSEHNLD